MLSTLACVAFLVVQLVAHSGCDQTAFLVTPARLLVTLAGSTELPPPPKSNILNQASLHSTALHYPPSQSLALYFTPREEVRTYSVLIKQHSVHHTRHTHEFITPASSLL